MSIVLGDFNEVRHEHERLGTLFCKRGATLFNGFINNSGLIGLPMGEHGKISDFKAKISMFDTKAEHDTLGENEIIEHLDLLKKIEDSRHLKRLDLMQKAKIRWAIESDKNKKFFNGIVNNTFSRSRINGLLIEGLPIGTNMNKVCNWKPIIDKFHNRLTTWKAKTLFYGDRLTLIKSVLGALATYFFPSF
ncbi:RNA-directed DNA polymerase, eukaryota, Reverse transcriptase zinc-binding domain protein [Artemisia annua]|uniref:RNA-directed DNA polymerase, eukaryota, Reverse transcriptase zinc-binding domain protein n=1 Tax=Artemisia annua TaxID=35608 RepID=A0A2U1MDR4_ARTAN|nr:RNA-directed DNA polymerase, eukaryota, Reverse transcriptase zinc-binding domain protein [Artemisia annua]